VRACRGSGGCRLPCLWGSVPLADQTPGGARADSLFSRCRAELRLPACAIGGIRLDNAAPLLAVGVDLLAVISDLFDAPDVAARAAAYQQLFKDETREFPQSATF
jgi:thiamine-phosphate pyrophosphorylase